MAATTQDIVEQITVFPQMGDTATGREIMSYIYRMGMYFV